MSRKYVTPLRGTNIFTCPHCNAFAAQTFKPISAFSSSGNLSLSGISSTSSDFAFSWCHGCFKYGIWVGDTLVYPNTCIAPTASEDMPADLATDFEEARAVFSASPRSSAALLRLVLQKLCIHLGGKGKNINDDIAALVKAGLSVQVEQALDVVRVVGNNAVHPGELNIQDEPQIALSLFEIVNIIVDRMITEPKNIQAMHDRLPDGAKEAIQKRERKTGQP